MANIYDALRDKAKAMGHAAASLPDSVWQDYMQKQDKKATLTEAKLYMEQYMMGDLSPADFAQVMVENDQLRYTISDLCRMRLEPANLNIPRNDGYIDLAAGFKTFWSEIHVPLPSEMSAARDMQHINLGIQAAQNGGVQTQGQNAGQSPVVTAVPHEKTSLGGRIRQARQFAANKAVGLAEKTIEKLKPYTTEQAEETNKGQATAQKFDESWFETEDGRIYKNVYTQKAAQHIEGLAMTVEAARTGGLEPDQRRRAMQAAGLTDDVIRAQMGEDAKETSAEAAKKPTLRSGYTPEELNRPLNDQMQELFDQIAKHMGQDQKTKTEAKKERTEVPRKDKKEVEKSAVKKTISSQDKKEVEKPVEKEVEKPAEKRTIKEKVEKGVEEKKDIKDIKVPEKRLIKGQMSSEFSRDTEKNRIYATYRGYDVYFRSYHLGHEFTDEEVSKLLAGEKITFENAMRDGSKEMITGQLEWQSYSGRKSFGFKAEEPVKEVEKPTHGKDVSDDPAAAYYARIADEAAAAEDLEKKVHEIPINYPDEMALQ